MPDVEENTADLWATLSQSLLSLWEKSPEILYHFFFSRNHIILKASSACCGQSDSSQHWIILGSGEESKAAGAPGAMVQVFYRRRGPQTAHLWYHLYVGAMLNCLIFCFGFSISWIGFCCLQEDAFFEIKRMREHHLHSFFLWRMNFGKEGWAVTLKLNCPDLWELCRLLKYSNGVYFKSKMWRQTQRRAGWNCMRFPSGCPGHRCDNFLELRLHHWSLTGSSKPPATSLSPLSGPGSSPSPWMCSLLFLFLLFFVAALDLHGFARAFTRCG